MNLPVIILGAGGHGKVLADCLLRRGISILGFTESDPCLKGSRVLEIPILGTDEIIKNFPTGDICLVNGLGSARDTSSRKKLFMLFSNQGYRFSTVIHPDTIISRFAKVGEGAQVMAGAVLQAGCRIGRDTIINTRSSIDHDCLIGDHVHIAPGVTLSGNVTVLEGTHIGAGSTVIQGVQIGRQSLVAAGTVVINDVPPLSTVMGVPGRIVRSDQPR